MSAGLFSAFFAALLRLGCGLWLAARMLGAPRWDWRALGVLAGGLVVFVANWPNPLAMAVGLIGLNGAGKTTLLNVLSGLHPNCTVAAAQFQGAPLRFDDEVFKRQRYTVFAEDHAFGYLSFQEYLHYTCAAYDSAPQGVDALLAGFHFDAYQHVPIRDLSTGNRKKAFLITAFALRPPLLFLDEPVNGLDFQSTEFLYRTMAAYRAWGTLLFSSHVLESITLTADRVLVLAEGRITRTFEDASDAQTIREVLGHDRDAL